MAPPKTTDYAALLRKLKQDLVNSTPSAIEKKPKREERYYPTNSQLWLLGICGFKSSNEPLVFNFSTEANQFVNLYTMEKIKFLEEHGKMPGPCISFSHFLGFSHNRH
jgi:hypothetical protein